MLTDIFSAPCLVQYNEESRSPLKPDFYLLKNNSGHSIFSLLFFDDILKNLFVTKYLLLSVLQLYQFSVFFLQSCSSVKGRRTGFFLDACFICLSLHLFFFHLSKYFLKAEFPKGKSAWHNWRKYRNPRLAPNPSMNTNIHGYQQSADEN